MAYMLDGHRIQGMSGPVFSYELRYRKSDYLRFSSKSCDFCKVARKWYSRNFALLITRKPLRFLATFCGSYLGAATLRFFVNRPLWRSTLIIFTGARVMAALLLNSPVFRRKFRYPRVNRPRRDPLEHLDDVEVCMQIK